MQPQLVDTGGGGGFDTGVSVGTPAGGTGGSGGASQRQASAGQGTTPASTSGTSWFTWPSISWGRLAAFLLGLILILMGIYLIKPVQQVVNTTVKTAGKAAAAAAAEGSE